MTPPACLAVSWLLWGCSGADDPSAPCPEGMVRVSGGEHVLGEGALPVRPPVEPTAVIRRASFRTEPFCIDVHPFPGAAGHPWPLDGLDVGTARALDRRLAAFGRRLCSVSELLFASAGPDNWRYPYDPGEWRDGACDPDDSRPRPIGSFPSCTSPLGIADVGVRSSWARLDPPMRDHLVAYGAPTRPAFMGGGLPSDLEYAVYGGASRRDTFYSPDNYGVHSHGSDEEPFSDDTTRVCRDPGPVDPEAERRYREWLSTWPDSPTFSWLLTVE